MNYDNIQKVISCWVDVQSTSDEPFIREMLGISFKENLSTLNLDHISKNLIDVIFSMDYDELKNHISCLDLDEEDKKLVLSELEDL
jgi:hypothetical protein